MLTIIHNSKCMGAIISNSKKVHMQPFIYNSKSTRAIISNSKKAHARHYL